MLRTSLLVNGEGFLQDAPGKQWRDNDAPPALPRHIVGDIACSARVQRRMRLLHGPGNHGQVFHFVELAVVRKSILRPTAHKNVNRFVITRPALLEWNIGGVEQPGMPASQAAFQPPSCQDIGFCNLSRQSHGVFQGQRKEGDAEPDSFGPLGGRSKERKRIRGNRKFLKEMMINYGVDIETHLVRVLDLTQNLPGHGRMGFPWRRLHLRVNTESPVRIWLLGLVWSHGTIHFPSGTLDQTNMRSTYAWSAHQ